MLPKFWLATLLLLLTLGRCFSSHNYSNADPFDVNYQVTYGYDHATILRDGQVVRLSMDKQNGAGFGSKLNYGSGLFEMRIKVPNRNSAGVVTAFYLRSHTNEHDELDMEFLGNVEGHPIRLQTNIFINGQGNREEKVSLWFDPSKEFHTYRILWNPHWIVFFVDYTPIRVYKNRMSEKIPYPFQPMQIIASIWNGEDWATDGGKIKIDWNYAPFMAYFRHFSVSGCVPDGSNINHCYSPHAFWNRGRYITLTLKEWALYKEVRAKYLLYAYCMDKKRYPIPPPECLPFGEDEESSLLSHNTTSKP